MANPLGQHCQFSAKTAIEYGHMRHLYGVQTNRLIIATAIVRSMQNKWAYNSAVRQR
jgi:hypothetical protein